MNTTILTFGVAILMTALAAVVSTEDWPGGGRSSLEQNAPVDWNATSNIAWKVVVHSCPRHAGQPPPVLRGQS